MKLKNIKVGMVLQYKGGDTAEYNNFNEGDLCVVFVVNDPDEGADCIAVRDMDNFKESTFEPRYLRKAQISQTNTVAGYQGVSGNVNPRMELARRLIITPPINDNLKAANKLINDFTEESVNMRDILSMWINFMLVGEVSRGEFKDKLALVMEYIRENEI